MTFPLVGIDAGGANTAAIYQDRLVLAGTHAVTDLVMASRTGEWDQFRLGETRQDESGANVFVSTPADGFWFQQASARANTFHAILQQEGMFLFGDLGEANIPRGIFQADQVAIDENSWHGSDPGRTPLIISGLAVFIQKGGNDIRGFNWNEVERKYVAPSVLDKAGQIAPGFVDMAFSLSGGRRADTLYAVSEDGRVPVMTLKHQDPNYAWNVWETGPMTEDGNGRPMPMHKVIGAAAPLGRQAFLVDRNGEIGVETLDMTEEQTCDGISFTRGVDEDASVFANRLAAEVSWGEVSAMDEMAPYVCIRRADGNVERFQVRDANGRMMDARVGVSGGRITNIPVELLPDASLDPIAHPVNPGDSIEIGWPYMRIVETLPFIAPSQSGTRRSVTKSRILDVAVDFTPDATPRNIRLGVGGRMKLTKNLRAVRDAGSINRRRFGGRAGWKDRVAVRLEFDEPVEMVGIATKAVG